MQHQEKIKTAQQLEFAIFCIENTAIRLGIDVRQVYEALTEKSGILNEYLVPEYEVLHTQGKEYIVDDILELLEERGVKLANISLDDALAFFYHSDVYMLVSEGVSDMHCMSDAYLADELLMEYHGVL